MKYRPSVSFLLCLLGIAATETAVISSIGWGIPAPKDVPADQATLDYLEKRKPQPRASIYVDDFAAFATANFSAGEEVKRKLLAEFPIFAFKGGEVPDKRNAYDPIRSDREMDRLRRGKKHPQMTNPSLGNLAGLPDVATFEVLLGEPEYNDLLAKIEHLAKLPPSSSPEEVRIRSEGLSEGSGREYIGVLLEKAKRAAEAKNEAEAIRFVEAAIHLSSYFDPLGQAVQFPHLPASRELIQEFSLTRILHYLGPDADLPRWRKMLADIPPPSKSAWADNLRENWHWRVDITIVQSLRPANSARARTILAVERRHSLRVGRLLAFAEGDTSGTFSPPKRVLGEFYCGTNGYTRNLARRVRILAALELLILEKSGVTLDANSMDQISTGMLSGETPLFDPATRQISFAQSLGGDIWLGPIKLPW